MINRIISQLISDSLLQPFFLALTCLLHPAVCVWTHLVAQDGLLDQPGITIQPHSWVAAAPHPHWSLHSHTKHNKLPRNNCAALKARILNKMQRLHLAESVSKLPMQQRSIFSVLQSGSDPTALCRGCSALCYSLLTSRVASSCSWRQTRL